MYRPNTEIEKKVFPNLGEAKITGGLPEYIGKVGTIIYEDEGAARIAFDEFWDRNTDEIDGLRDNTWVFKGEYERIGSVA